MYVCTSNYNSISIYYESSIIFSRLIRLTDLRYKRNDKYNNSRLFFSNKNKCLKQIKKKKKRIKDNEKPVVDDLILPEKLDARWN